MGATENLCGLNVVIAGDFKNSSDGVKAKARPDTPPALTLARGLYTRLAGVAISQIRRMTGQARDKAKQETAGSQENRPLF